MTGIERVGWPATSRASSRVATRSGFSVPLQSAATGVATAATETSGPALASMLTLQEMGGEAVRDREARQHGQYMLAALADLQRALLSSGDEVTVLANLAGLVASVPQAADRGLAAMVSAIVVRVRVELARRQA